MSRFVLSKISSFLTVLLITGHAAVAADVDPCTRFKWDVSHELAVMKQTPHPVTAAVAPGPEVPSVRIDTLYEVQLADQTGVKFVASPAKPTLPDGAHAGLARFRLDKPGLYRVAITSGHWIDVVDGSQPLKSRDFQGARGCERPHKIVEYELPAGRDLTLQFSGATDARILVSITAVSASASP